MNRHFLFSLLLMIGFNCYAQIDFEKGYFIDDNNNRTECLIRHVEWHSNPTQFKYKLAVDQETQEGDIANIKEFGVADLRYIKATVDIDQSSNDTKKLDYNRNPIWKMEVVFLKLLLEGKANLYYYKARDYERFLYSVENGPVKQLVYKSYIVNLDRGEYEKGRGIYVRTNGTYINQLQKEVSCGKNSSEQLQKLRFERKALINYFTKYNECTGGTSTTLQKTTKDKVHLKLTPGIDFSSIYAANFNGIPTKAFPEELSVRVGVEGELFLPFNKKKWSVMFEPAYQSYKPSGHEANYTSIEIAGGGRHHFYLSKNAAIFINGGLVMDIPLQYKVAWRNTGTITYKALGLNSFAGIGFRVNRISFEGRYNSGRSQMDETGLWYVEYKKTNIILGYRIF